MQFAQAQIEVRNQQIFDELKRAIENALVARSDDFLQLVKRFGLRIREFEKVLKEHLFEQLPGAKQARTSEQMYLDLGASDQGLIREFYLTRIEEIPVELRTKYLKLFRYQ